MNILEEIAQGETYDLEFKLIPNEDRIKYLKTVVAFANGKGGRILFGVADDRTVHGIANDKVYAEMDAIGADISGVAGEVDEVGKALVGIRDTLDRIEKRYELVGAELSKMKRE